jgi:hypothetical protein
MFFPMMRAYRVQYCSVDARAMFHRLAQDDMRNQPPSKWADLITNTLSINHVRSLLVQREASMG